VRSIQVDKSSVKQDYIIAPVGHLSMKSRDGALMDGVMQRRLVVDEGRPSALHQDLL
jgi:hypothetical protein